MTNSQWLVYRCPRTPQSQGATFLHSIITFSCSRRVVVVIPIHFYKKITTSCFFFIKARLCCCGGGGGEFSLILFLLFSAKKTFRKFPHFSSFSTFHLLFSGTKKCPNFALFKKLSEYEKESYVFLSYFRFWVVVMVLRLAKLQHDKTVVGLNLASTE